MIHLPSRESRSAGAFESPVGAKRRSEVPVLRGLDAEAWASAPASESEGVGAASVRSDLK